MKNLTERFCISIIEKPNFLLTGISKAKKTFEQGIWKNVYCREALIFKTEKKAQDFINKKFPNSKENMEIIEFD